MDSGNIDMHYEDNNIYDFLSISEVVLVTARCSEVISGGRSQRRDACGEVWNFLPFSQSRSC